MPPLDKKDIRSTLILITSVLVIAIIITTVLWLSGKTVSTGTLIKVLIVAPIFIILSWIYYFNQKKRDTNPNQPESLIQKGIQADIKVSGGIRKIQSIIAFIISPIMIIGGMLTLLGIRADFEMELNYKLIIGIPIILIGIAIFFVAIYLWKLGSVQSKGRMYKQEPQQ